MCRRAVGLLLGGADGILKDVLLESYAIHLRTLIDFIHAKSHRDDDLSAASYAKAHEPWFGGRGSIPETLRVARRRADKQIVHFTKKRYNPGTPETQWPVVLEATALVEGLRLFLRYADPNKLDPIIADDVARLAALMTPLTISEENR